MRDFLPALRAKCEKIRTADAQKTLDRRQIFILIILIYARHTKQSISHICLRFCRFIFIVAFLYNWIFSPAIIKLTRKQTRAMEISFINLVWFVSIPLINEEHENDRGQFTERSECPEGIFNGFRMTQPRRSKQIRGWRWCSGGKKPFSSLTPLIFISIPSQCLTQIYPFSILLYNNNNNRLPKLLFSIFLTIRRVHPPPPPLKCF